VQTSPWVHVHDYSQKTRQAWQHYCDLPGCSAGRLGLVGRRCQIGCRRRSPSPQGRTARECISSFVCKVCTMCLADLVHSEHDTFSCRPLDHRIYPFSFSSFSDQNGSCPGRSSGGTFPYAAGVHFWLFHSIFAVLPGSNRATFALGSD